MVAKDFKNTITTALLTVFLCVITNMAVEQDVCSPCTCDEARDYMECSWTDLISIPSFIPYDTKVLRFVRNDIEVLRNDSFLTLYQLEELYLSRNKLSIIENIAFRGLQGLKNLELSQNDIENLPEMIFSFLTNLESLDLSSNSLTGLHQMTFLHLTSLKTLNLQGNRIGQLQPNSFSHMPALQSLLLSDNVVPQIDDGMLVGMGNLQLLDLKNNKVRQVSSGAFHNVTQIKTIDLSGANEIEYLEGETFEFLLSLEELRLNGNPFVCTCQLYSFRYWMSTASHVSWSPQTSASCVSPQPFEGRNIYSIPPTDFICTTTTTTTTTTQPTTTTVETTTEAATMTTTVETTQKPAVVTIINQPSSTQTTWYMRPPSTASPVTSYFSENMIVIIVAVVCSAVVLIIIIAIIIACMCGCRCGKNRGSDSGMYKVRENNIASDQIRSNHVRFENEMNGRNDENKFSNDKSPDKTPNGKPSNGVPNGKLSNGNGLIPNGHSPEHNKKIPFIEDYTNEGYTNLPTYNNSNFHQIYHTDLDLDLTTKYSDINLNNTHHHIQPEYIYPSDVSYNPAGSSFDEHSTDSRPTLSTPVMNSSSDMLPAWEYPPLAEEVPHYEGSLCSQSSASSKKVRSETYV